MLDDSQTLFVSSLFKNHYACTPNPSLKMAAHAPYIMPDGRSLQTYLHQEREREQLRRRKAELRGKDLQFAQLLRQRGAASSELELAELKAMESAGERRGRGRLRTTHESDGNWRATRSLGKC